MTGPVRLERKNYNVYEKPGFFQKHKKLVIALVVLLVLALIGVGIYSGLHKKQTSGRLEEFTEALEAKDYAAASEIYRTLQASVTEKKVGSAQREELEKVQYAMEDIVRGKVRAILDDVIQGHPLTDEEKAFIEGLKEISAAEVMPLLHEKSEEWLDGKITQTEWEQIIGAFEDLDNLSRLVGDLKRQEEGMALAVDRFRMAEKIEARGDWEYTWQYWQDLVDDPDLAIFARDYANFRLKQYQEQEYHNLIALSDELMEEERYYTALKLIDRMHSVFPDREELKTRLRDLNQLVPQRLDKWIDMVPVLAVRPLIAREDEAFLKGKNTLHAKNNLLTCKEFRRFLEELYKNDYVLIRASVFENYPERNPEIVVPRGKKPVILLMEHAAYTTLNQANGTVQRLIYDAETDTFNGFYQAMNRDVIAPDNNLFGILEQFIDEHPDFSFDGARGILSLFVMEDVLGNIVDQTQLEHQNEARERQALMPFEMTAEDFALEQKEADRNLKALKKHGWELALGGVDDYLFNQYSAAEMEAAINRWREVVGPEGENTTILAFPDGALVYNQEDVLAAILDSGFTLLVGLGPDAYNFYYPSFVHMDRQTVSPLSMQAAEAWGLEPFFDASVVYDQPLRDKHGE